MTLSIRERILAAIKTKLDDIEGVTAYRNRDTEVLEDKLPAVIQHDGGMSREYDGNNTVRVTMRVDIECQLKAATDEDLGPAISDLYAKITEALLEDPTVEGLATDFKEADEVMGDPNIAKDSAKVPHAGFLMAFLVEFSHLPGDPYTLAP